MFVAVTCEACEDSFYIFGFDWDAYNALNVKIVEGERVADDEGVEEAFEVAEVSEGEV